MANDKNLQDTFLNHIRKEKELVTLFLVNGIKLQGIVTWFDNFSILLKREAQLQLVYKHAISTIMPSNHFKIYPYSADDSGEGEKKEKEGTAAAE